MVYSRRERSRVAYSRWKLRRAIQASGLFDASFYLSRYADALASGQDPLDHYIETGRGLGYWPSAEFDPELYAELHPDVAAEGALVHFIRHGRGEGRRAPDTYARARRDIESSGLFDPEFYLAYYPDALASGQDPLDHYLATGSGLGYWPSADFDPELYTELHPDVAADGEAALLHFIRHGLKEGRRAPDAHARARRDIELSGLFDPDFYAARYPDAVAAGQDPLDHYVETGRGLGYWPSADFDPELYAELHPDVAAEGEEPLLHFIRHGFEERRQAPDAHTRARRDVESSGLFDPDFYVARYSDALGAGQDPLDHYIETGSGLGYWPSANFDPGLYAELYPDVAAGEHAFLHFIRHGRREGRRVPDARAKLWREIERSGLFDADFYRARYSDALASGQDPLDHYIETGSGLGYWPSADFDPGLYVELYPDVAAEAEEPLLHFVRRGRGEGRQAPDRLAQARRDIESSGLFDPDLYRELYPDVAERGLDPLDHYLSCSQPGAYRPSMEFDGGLYLSLHPDLAAAGVNPLRHYVEYGRKEGRTLPPVVLDRVGLAAARERLRASNLFSPEYYLSENPVVVETGVDPILHYLVLGYRDYQEPSPDVSMQAYVAEYADVRERGINPLLHYLDHGRHEGRQLRKSVAEARWCGRQDGRELPDDIIHFELMAARSFFSRHGFTYESSGPLAYAAEGVATLAIRQPLLGIERLEPQVSIIIPVYGQLPFVLSCLDSLLRHESRHTVEIIISDDASPEETETRRLEAIPWVRYLRRQTNGGFIDCCNSAADSARGKYIVLLNSDTRLVRGWLDELIGSFELFPNAGYVGSKLFYPDATLQEAGGIYWSDGTAWNYGRGQDPNHPKYCFARRVDYASGAAIAVPTAIWQEVGGFDAAYRPAYCEDADLAFRLRDRGYEVWYQPLARVIHYEGMTHGRDETQGIKAYQTVNMRRLRERWSQVFKTFRKNGHDPEKEADRQTTQRILVVDAVTPTPDQDSGSFITEKMIRAFQELGFGVSFVPQHNYLYVPFYTSALQRIGVECLYHPFFDTIDQAVSYRDDFDYVLVYRHNVASSMIDPVRRAIPSARIIFHNTDLHYLREMRQAQLAGNRTGIIRSAMTKNTELETIAKADCTIVHTPVERTIIVNDLPVPIQSIVEFPYICDVRYSSASYEERRDVMFLGGFAHPPNVDAVEFFLGSVWPLVRERLPSDAKFLVVGASPSAEVRALASERVVVTGHVPDLSPWFDKARVFVAPLRYGAGIKGKLIQSLSHGVPSVVTSIASEGIGLVDGNQCVIADDPDAFAQGIMELYEDPRMWSNMQSAGYAFVEERFSWKRCLSICEDVLNVADATWLAREQTKRTKALAELMRTNLGSGLARDGL